MLSASLAIFEVNFNILRDIWATYPCDQHAPAVPMPELLFK
jgi:hypothetical protein